MLTLTGVVRYSKKLRAGARGVKFEASDGDVPLPKLVDDGDVTTRIYYDVSCSKVAVGG